MELTTLQKQVAIDYCRTGSDYLKVGLDLFFERRSSDWQHFQVSMGNIAIGLELLMKSSLIQKNLSLIFKELPIDIQIALTVPNSYAHNNVIRRFDLELGSGTYKTIEFDECLGRLYIFFPELKELFASHLKFIGRQRNVCVHGSFPLFQRYDLERTAYIALKMTQYLVDKKLLSIPYDLISKREKDFLTNFDDERIQRVKEVTEAAKNTTLKLKIQHVSISTSGWEEMVIKCPICKNDAIIIGTTEYSVEPGEEYAEETLTFFAEEFQCDTCKMTLRDQEEFRLANLSIIYDRSDETEIWHYDNQDYGDY